jgi:asparagine synthase (glutamine-hydrolysing)
MCGFAGVVGTGTRIDVAAMCEPLARRGPDAFALWSGGTESNPVHFGFRRLIVLDPAGGRQPMINEALGLTVVFNGAIYNHRELRRELIALGARFRTDHSDTEVLLHAYAQWGSAFVRRLNGMFAFALYDSRGSRLVLCRDRFGKKPLYYASTLGGIAFGSELSALRRHPSVSARINRDALARFFAFGYVPAPQSLLADVRKLQGGDCAVYDIGARTLTIEPYWRYRVDPDRVPPGTETDWSERLRELLQAAVTRRLESDVPLGFLLSGGVDSAAVLALARRARPDAAMTAYTIGFEERTFDESAAAAGTARALSVRHVVRMFDAASARDGLDDILRAMDEPVADPSLLPTSWLSKLAREEVTVALSGDGGDELFAGYDTFGTLGLARLYSAIVPLPLHKALRAAVDRMPRSDRNVSLDFKVRRALRGLSYPESLWTAQWMSPADVPEIERALGVRLSPENLYGDVVALWSASASTHPGDRMLEYFANYYLQHGVLTKVDRASMHWSLEVRSPLLDVDVAEFCLALPYRAKHKGVRKRILRLALQGIVPAEVMNRPKKGFGIPVAAWLRRWGMPSLDRAAGLGLNGAWLGARWQEHQSGRADHRGLLFAWLCLDRWVAANN